MSDEHEALARLLWSREFRYAKKFEDDRDDVQDGFREDADAILASDWLARRPRGTRGAGSGADRRRGGARG
jgi:hypothetical protein